MLLSIRKIIVATVLFAPMPMIGSVSAQQREVVQGKVLDTDKKPIEGVEVMIVGAATRASQSATTNKRGEFVATFQTSEGTYALSFRKVGYLPFSRTIAQGGLSTIVTVPDVALAPSLTTLQPITVGGGRILRVPTKGEIASIGAAEVNTTSNAQFLFDPADLNALIAMLPGVLSVGDSGYSVLGASSTENNTTIDGMSFGGSSLPRDAVSRSKLVTSTFDVSKGQFSGAENVISLRSGLPEFAATMRGELLDPRLAWADPQAVSPVPQIGAFSGFVTGPIVRGKVNYIASFDLNRRLTKSTTLLAPREDLLAQFGISPDSVAALRTALTSLGVPVTDPSIPSHSTTLRGVGTLRVDYRVNALTSFSFEAIPSLARAGGVGLGALALPSGRANSAAAARG